MIPRFTKVHKIDEWVGEQNLTPENYHHRIPLMGMISEFPIHYARPKEGISKCMKDAETNVTFFDKFKPGNFMKIGPGSEKTWNFDQYPDNPRGKLDGIAQQGTQKYLVQKHPILRRIEASVFRRQCWIFETADGPHQFRQRLGKKEGERQ